MTYIELFIFDVYTADRGNVRDDWILRHRYSCVCLMTQHYTFSSMATEELYERVMEVAAPELAHQEEGVAHFFVNGVNNTTEEAELSAVLLSATIGAPVTALPIPTLGVGLDCLNAASVLSSRVLKMLRLDFLEPFFDVYKHALHIRYLPHCLALIYLICFGRKRVILHTHSAGSLIISLLSSFPEMVKKKIVLFTYGSPSRALPCGDLADAHHFYFKEDRIASVIPLLVHNPVAKSTGDSNQHPLKLPAKDADTHAFASYIAAISSDPKYFEIFHKVSS